MKNIFKNFFGGKTSDTAATLSQPHQVVVEPTESEPVIPRNLFIEETPPGAMEIAATSTSLIREYLDRNHEQRGLLMGYEYPSGDMMDHEIKSIGASFRLILDVEMQKVKSQKLELQMHLAKVGNEFTELVEQLRIMISEKEELILAMGDQKSLSVEHEGWISEPVHAFKIGFFKGMSQYLKEKTLLETYKPL